MAFGGTRSFEHIDGFSASFLYAGAIADAVKRYKFNYERYYADFFAQFMDVPESWHIDIVVPYLSIKSVCVSAALTKASCLPRAYAPALA